MLVESPARPACPLTGMAGECPPEDGSGYRRFPGQIERRHYKCRRDDAHSGLKAYKPVEGIHEIHGPIRMGVVAHNCPDEDLCQRCRGECRRRQGDQHLVTVRPELSRVRRCGERRAGGQHRAVSELSQVYTTDLKFDPDRVRDAARCAFLAFGSLRGPANGERYRSRMRSRFGRSGQLPRLPGRDQKRIAR